MTNQIVAPQAKIERVQRQILERCQACNGQGCSKCRAMAARIERYALAGIPTAYWLLPWKNYQGDSAFKEKIEEISTNIEKFYDVGKSLVLVGNLGTGKTYAACTLLKKAATTEFSIRYTVMLDVANMILSDKIDTHQFLKDLIQTDFLVIDEFDPRWIFPSEKSERIFGSSMEHILRSRFHNNLPTILCSNADDVDKILAGEFERTFTSLRSLHADVIYVGGKDFRRSSQANG